MQRGNTFEISFTQKQVEDQVIPMAPVPSAVGPVKGVDMATIDTIKDILSENLDIAPEKVTDDTTFQDLGIDSLDMVELICDLEERCGIDFGEPEGIENIGQLVTYVDSLKA